MASIDVKLSDGSASSHLANPIQSSREWLNQVDKVNNKLGDIISRSTNARRVKIAILDSGCDANAEYFAQYPEGRDRLDGQWKDFVCGSETLVDQDPQQHGTNLTMLLLRVARHAEIFVARVAKDANSLEHSDSAISKAIRYACKEWDVDIITMSFGLKTQKRRIQKAIAKGKLRKNEEVIFFAAANNNGLNEPELFPANDVSVISVCGTRFNGSSEPSYCPASWPHKAGEPQFGTLAVDVPCAGMLDQRSGSGCSFACPIMTAIAAIILEQIASLGDKISSSFRKLAKTREGMIQLLIVAAIQSNKNEQKYYLPPWCLFEMADGRRLVMIQSALARLPPSE